ncbi:MAG: hypothetical protein JO353_09580 [Phycisphaerae bacterium]|nr:hypothetical protein [Phycisphaerae bacterium]
MKSRSTPNRRIVATGRRGSVYLVVLGLSMLVTILALGAIAAGLAQRRSGESLNDAADARHYAKAAVDMGRYAISQDANWRTDYAPGTWINTTMGSGSCSLGVIDPIDGNLGNRPYDAVRLTGTGYKGKAIQMVQATMVGSGTPIDALQYALFVPGMLHNMAAATSFFANATLATNGTYQTEGSLFGNVSCFLTAGPGTTYGTVNTFGSSTSTPPTTIESMYVALGTAISPGIAMQQVVLTSTYNPYGAANSDGVYVITASADMTIQNCRINGTLVVVDPGHTVTFNGSILMSPARKDFPVMIIDGNAIFSCTTAALSEATCAANFNPSGAPYNGVSNSTMTDTYPSMISGLVHVKGTVKFQAAGLIHGAVICESTASPDAVQINANEEIDYDPTLYTNPPQGYTKSVTMSVQPGSWTRVVN